MVRITVGGGTSGPNILGLSPTLIAAMIALTGVLMTIWSTAKRQRESFEKTAEMQREVERRKRSDEVRAVRGLLFAQLARVYRTIQDEYVYLADSGMTFVWFPIYLSLMPSAETLRRAEVLTGQELMDVTAFHYSYQENMGYIAALGYEREKGPPAVKFDYQMIGVDYGRADRELAWMITALVVIEGKARAAMEAILKATREEIGGDGGLLEKLEEDMARSGERAKEGAKKLTLVQTRIEEARQRMKAEV